MIIEKLYLFLIIVLTGTVYAVLGSTVVLALSTLILIYLFLSNAKTKYEVNSLVTYFVLTIVLFAILLFHYLIVPLSNDPLPYITLYFRFNIVALFLVYIKSNGIDFIYLLQSVLKWITYHAIFALILSFFVTNYLINVDSENIHSHTFLYLFFYNSNFQLLGLNLYRNQGIFWEPGILQIYMNILFFISSFIIRSRKFQIFSAFLILTTYSTTGIAILLLQLLVILFSEKIGLMRRISLCVILLTVAIPIFIFNSSQKVNDDNATNDQTSSAFRIYDFMEGVSITSQYPLTGIGLSEDTYKAVKNASNTIFANYSQDFTNLVLDRRSSNSVMYFLTRFGIPFSLGCFIILYRQSLFAKKKWLFFLIVMLSNLSEPLLISPFFILIAASGFYDTVKFKLKTSPGYDFA